MSRDAALTALSRVLCFCAYIVFGYVSTDVKYANKTFRTITNDQCAVYDVHCTTYIVQRTLYNECRINIILLHNK